MPKPIVLGFAITLNPDDPTDVTLLFIDPQVQTTVPGHEHYVIEGNFNGTNKHGEAVSYTYTAHAYVNLPRRKEFVTNMIRRLVKRHGSDLVNPFD
jgi:hypothetical protein